MILSAGLILSNINIDGNPMLTTILILLGMTTYFSWILLVGHGLYQLLPPKIEMNYNLFLINSFISLAAYVTAMVLSDGRGMTFSGVAAIPILYVFYAFLHFMMFPARTLRSIEKKQKAGVGESLGDFFLIVLLPIGIWFLQPRINRLVEGDNDTNPASTS